MNTQDDNTNAAPKEGDVIEHRLQLLRELGGGAMGVVFEAEQIALRRRVAVKFIRPATANPDSVMRFLREAQACAKVSHPNVIDVYELGTFRALPYLVMPLLRGESLGQRLEREGSLPVQDVVAIGVAVLRGLHAAHEQGIVHRDVKPDNVYLVEGEVPGVRVVDFGVAKLLEPEPGHLATQEGSQIGTPLYMSPEQVNGSTTIDRRADIYSVAAMLYHLLAGKPPFHATTLTALYVAILTTESAPLGTHRDDVPAALNAALSKALSKERADRFASAEEFAQALEAAISQRVIPSQSTEQSREVAQNEVLPVPSVQKQSTDVRRARRLGIPAALLVTLGGMLALHQIRRPEPAREVTPTARTTALAEVQHKDATEDVAPAAEPVPSPSRVRVIVDSEENAEVFASGVAATRARFRRAGEHARAELMVSAGTRRVCCRIPGEIEQVCRPIVYRDGVGHASCFAE